MLDFFEAIDALSLLTPCDVPSVPKVRIGNKTGDGGYVMADRFRSGQKVYSYGISTEISFDLELAERGLEIFMYDHTVSGLPFSHPNFNFFRQGLAPRNIPEESLYSLEYHTAMNHHTENDMILKMDIEGAEWSVLGQIDPGLLSRFEQLTLEIHFVDQSIKSSELRGGFKSVFRKITSLFHIIHVHSNNAAPIIDTADGIPVPQLLEISCLRKDLGPSAPWSRFIPSALDAPNMPRPDQVLAFFPFLPTRLPPDQFKRGLIDACRKASGTVKAKGTNIAVFGTCSQSSLSPWSAGADEANRAVRGEKTGGFAFHTDIEREPWWQIDFGTPRHFDEVICYNRISMCSDRARSLIVEISLDQTNWDIIHRNFENFGGIDGSPLRVVRERARARYVRLRLKDKNMTSLHLDAVEIYDWADRTVPRQVSGKTAGGARN